MHVGIYTMYVTYAQNIHRHALYEPYAFMFVFMVVNKRELRKRPRDCIRLKERCKKERLKTERKGSGEGEQNGKIG